MSKTLYLLDTSTLPESGSIPGESIVYSGPFLYSIVNTSASAEAALAITNAIVVDSSAVKDELVKQGATLVAQCDDMYLPSAHVRRPKGGASLSTSEKAILVAGAFGLVAAVTVPVYVGMQELQLHTEGCPKNMAELRNRVGIDLNGIRLKDGGDSTFFQYLKWLYVGTRCDAVIKKTPAPATP